ncbi:hypothetical protein OROHE_002893 [Orobanche hederae]
MLSKILKQLMCLQCRTYFTTPITKTPPPKTKPLCNELRLTVDQNPLDISIHGYWRAYQQLLNIRTKRSSIHYLINENPTPVDEFHDEFQAQQDLYSLDAATLFKLKSMWLNKSEAFMIREFVKHSLCAENMYKQRYFREIFLVARRYIGCTKNLKDFLKNNFEPRKEYNSKFVNKRINSFIGAKTKISFTSEGPTTLAEIGILRDDKKARLINHPNGNMSSVMMIVVAKEPDANHKNCRYSLKI